MALIGSVVNQGSMQGQINEANGNLTGLISSAELLGGQVVGMRGLKGDKGDQGDPGADGADGQDGFSPIANVSKVGDTATITITDSLGTTTATVEDGADGQDGADGHSPVITANKVGKVTTVSVDGSAIATINDGNDGQDGQDGQDGTDGQDGFSPSANVSKAGSVATITITDKDGTTTASVSDGSGVPSGGTAGQILTKHSATDYDVEWADSDAPTKTSDLINDSGFITGMTILSYGNSTWQNFIDAYNADKVVYCRASSNANPATGSQTRLAFMAYVNNATTPTEVEFQYYRSVSSHSASQQGDQVFVYKLNKTNGWSVTTREASSKIVAGTGMSSSYSSGVLTLTASGEANVQSDWSQSDTTADDYIKNKPTLFSGDYNDLSNKPTIPTKISELLNDLYEKGTTTAGSVTWTYRKWADKELEMWGEASTTLAINTASGSLYTTASTYEVAMPSFVASCDFFTGELSGGGWVDVTDMSNPPKVRFYAPTSYGSATRYLRYYMKGTWT